ncbi:MAG: S8 family serine peptidase [Anaerolineaceae bacterium]|nr:S8 family serine peptidase [Anaerolineaceae bacterium]
MIDKMETIEGKSQGSCLGIGLFILFGFFLIFFGGILQTVDWFIEQTIFEGSLEVKDYRWIIHLVFGLAQTILMFFLSFVVKKKVLKNIFRMFAFASISLLLTAPIRLFSIVSFQKVMLFIFVSNLILFFLIFLLEKNSKRKNFDIRLNFNHSYLYSLILIVVVTSIPWVIWGALGSVFDIILGLAAGFSSAFVIGFLLDRFLFQPFISQIDVERFGFIRHYSAILLLFIFCSSIAQNGNQWLISLTVPIFGLSFFGFVRKKGSIIEKEIQRNWFAFAINLGFVISWPLIFFDPDELMLIIAIEKGEILQWAGVAVIFSVINMLLISILILLFYHRIDWKKNRRISIFVLIMGTIAFLITGRANTHGEHIFVIMQDQANIASAGDIVDYDERRHFIYQELVNHAQEDQQEIVKTLNMLNIKFTSYYLVNAIEVEGGPILRMILAAREDVDRIIPSPELRPLPKPPPINTNGILFDDHDWNLKLIEADKVWKMGVTGEGILIGQSDSGVQGDHPELEDSYRGRNGNDDYNWFDPWNNSPSPVDIGGHGTHTLGTISGNQVGVAPDTEWIGCVNLARNLGNPGFYLDCMQFMLSPFPVGGDPFEDGDPSKGAHILNNSWGCPDIEGCDPETFLYAVKALRSAGIFVVVSAGNTGYSGCGSIDAPLAIYDEVFTVGAIDQSGNITMFSSLGPVSKDGSMRVKPDIVAPGANVFSSVPGSGYQFYDGTSMAGPHVAGVVALVWSAKPELIGMIDETERILIQSADKYTGVIPICVNEGDYPNNAFGYGVINAFNAVNLALSDE